MWQDGKRTLIWWIRCATFQATCWNLEKCEYWHHRLSTTKHYICMTSTRTISICLLPYLLFVLPWTCKTFYDHCMSWTCGLLSRHQFYFRDVIFCKSLYTICRINQSCLFRFIVYFTSNLWCGATHYLNRMGKMCNAFDSLNMRNAHYFYTCLPAILSTWQKKKCLSSFYEYPSSSHVILAYIVYPVSALWSFLATNDL